MNGSFGVQGRHDRVECGVLPWYLRFVLITVYFTLALQVGSGSVTLYLAAKFDAQCARNLLSSTKTQNKENSMTDPGDDII